MGKNKGARFASFLTKENLDAAREDTAASAFHVKGAPITIAEAEALVVDFKRFILQSCTADPQVEHLKKNPFHEPGLIGTFSC